MWCCPWLYDVGHALPLEGPPLRPLRLGPIRYAVRRRDARGITWVSNHAASYVLITLGVADLLASRWLGSDAGRLLAAWVVGWWGIRAASQLLIGHRRLDVGFVALFAALGGLHAIAAVA